MSDYQQRPGQGSLFVNRKKQGDKSPDMRGTALVEILDGETIEIEIAAWERESAKAGRWLSLSVKVKTRTRDDF